jgi:sugar diacid utilization regulator
MDDLNRRRRMYFVNFVNFAGILLSQNHHDSTPTHFPFFLQCCTQVRRASKPLWMHQNTVEYIVSAIETICTTQDMAQVLRKLSALQKNNNMAGLIRTIEKVVDWFQPLVSPV